jgi:hypothetical protein
MKNKKMIIVFALIAILLIAGIIVNVIAMKGKESEDLYTKVEDNVDNVYDNSIEDDELELSGEEYNSADVTDANDKEITITASENTPMLLIFWNNKEEKSIDALKTVQTYYSKYSSTVDIKAVAEVDQDEKSEIQNIISENNITIPVVYDTVDYSLSKANNVSEIPTILVINKKGEIINTLTEEITEDVIEANLDILIEKY